MCSGVYRTSLCRLKLYNNEEKLYKTYIRKIIYFCIQLLQRMIKINKTYRIISVLLALLVLVSSVGFTADMHYCKGELKSFSLFGKAQTCHDAEPMPSMPNCPHHQKMMEENKACAKSNEGCCDSETLHIQADIDQQVRHTAIELTPSQEQFVMAWVNNFIAPKVTTELVSPVYENPSPPIVSWDTHAYLQTYLL